MYVAGIDAGTQSIKVLVYDSKEKKEVALATCPLELISRDDGSREQHASWYIDAIENCFSQIEASIKEKIEAISVSGQQHGFVPVDENGQVLHVVKLWCDTSTVEECIELENSFGGKEKLIDEVGNPILVGYTASKILWFKKNHKDKYDKMKYVMLPHDYINYYLTGTSVMEVGDASGTALLNVKTLNWSEKLCNLIDKDLINKLPKLIKKPSIIAKLKESVASSLGLNNDVLVASGGGDNMMSAIGTGTVKNGSLTLSLGTSGTLFASSDVPLIDKKKRLAAFCSSHGSYLPLLCTMNCTVAEEVLRKEMNLSVTEFMSEAEKAPLGSEGLILLPFFNGERIPNYPNGEALLAGMNMTNVKRENIARCAIEGVTYEFLLGIEAFKELLFEPQVISLTGGGSKSEFWRQMISDLTLLKTRYPKVKEAAAFGACLQAIALATDTEIESVVEEHLVFDEEKQTVPNMENHEKYKKYYEKWKKYSEIMSPIFS